MGASLIVSVRRGIALTAILAASLALVGTVGAQPQPASAPGDVGFLGIPQNTSAETGIPFYFGANARLADRAMSDMRAAIAKCDRGAYNEARSSLIHVMANTAEVVRVPGETDAEFRRRYNNQSDRDAASLQEVANRAPPFPANCAPPAIGYNPGPFSVYLIGGGLVPLSGTGAVTGVDTFFGPGAFLIDNKQGGASSAVPMAGTRVRLTAQWNSFIERQLDQSTSLNAGYVGSRGPQVFIETGFQTAFGAQSFIQTFSGVSATPQGFGSNTVKENFQVPILIGVGVPVASPGQTPVFLDGYGGVTISNSTQTLQGREAGAPAGSGFFAAQTLTTVDPTVGVGLRAVFNNQSVGGVALPPLIIGANAELSFRPGSVVQAQSPNFPSESYYGTVDRRTMAVFMIRVGIPFGGTR